MPPVLLLLLPMHRCCSWAARVALLLLSMRTRTPLPMRMARVEPLLLLLPMWARALLDCCSY
jgi:hypothetical protein